jgi:gamma-glutamyl-gamma-aminobutyraldehyde dehydrogenase
VLLRLARLLEERADELALLVSLEMGKLVMDAVHVDVPFTAGCLQWYAETTDKHLKQVWLECGGKSANLVFADCDDLAAAADQACQGIFFNQGQVCSANSRLLVERGIKDEFLGLVLERAAALRPGNPLDPASTMGAMAGQRHTDRVLAAISAGRDDARLVLGGSRVSVGDSDCFVEPTVFDDVPNRARLAQDEIFGPVLAVTPFDTEPEALRLANESAFGIAASVWTGSLSRAHRVAGRLKVGTVSVNTVDAMSNQTPFGGVKQSGFGRDLSLHALDQYTALKTTWISY